MSPTLVLSCSGVHFPAGQLIFVTCALNFSGYKAPIGCPTTSTNSSRNIYNFERTRSDDIRDTQRHTH